MNPLLLTDFYKIHHNRMYPDGMTKLYSNFTPRKSRIKGVDKVVVFGIQHFILEYLIKKFNEDFFGDKLERKLSNEKNSWNKPTFKEKIITEYKRHCNVDTKHIEALWDLGYLPLEIKALDEGTLCPIGVPMLTITNTHPDFGWLVNYLETLLSCTLWQGITSATIAYEYKKLLTKYALETTGSADFVQWQGHDFSMRGMSSVESAILSGMGDLLSFTGTDTIPAIYQLETSYNATGLVGASVPATEHSVMCMGTKEAEVDTFRRLLNLYPKDILSVVSDTWNLWDVLTKFLPELKPEIMARDGKLVIRPDSGDPVDIICGTSSTIMRLKMKNKSFEDALGYELRDFDSWYDNPIWGLTKGNNPDLLEFRGKYFKYGKEGYHKDVLSRYKEVQWNESINEGVIELLWDIFGGTEVKGNDGKMYKVLDSHIGAIYGDSITLERAEQICERLKAKGFASTNVVLGIGSYTYQYNTRDTFGFAMKATYGEIQHSCPRDSGVCTEKCQCNCIEAREIFKDPITDDGTKKSKKGLLCVDLFPRDGETDMTIQCKDQCTWEEEKTGLLTTVFLDGKLVKETTLEEIRNRLKQ